MRQVFLDTETTGLSPESGDRVVEIGCIEMEGRRLTGRHLHLYLNPERKCSEGAFQVHGLSDAFLSTQPLFAAVVDELLAFVAGAEVVIHNASFDVGFLNEELRRLGRPPFAEHVAAITDSLAMAREIFPGKGNSLDALCKRLEVDNSGRSLHGALLDAGLLAEVFIRLTRGQKTLMIEASDGATGGGPLVGQTHFDRLVLEVLEPDADEWAAHEAVLKDIEASIKKPALWRAGMA